MLKINNQTDQLIVINDIQESVPADGVKEVPENEEFKWRSSQDLLIKITAGDLKIERNSVEYTDYAEQVKVLNNRSLKIDAPEDIDGAPMTRVKMFKSGVAVRFHFFGITTAKYSGAIHHKQSDNSTDFGYITSKIYDASDVEITSSANEGNAVKTVLDFEPPNLNYEIIAGKFYQTSPPATDIYVHVVAVPDVPAASGGSINFCSNANLKRMPSGIAFETDGRVPKKMNYTGAPLHLSKMRIIFFHDAGVQHECMGELEIAH